MNKIQRMILFATAGLLIVMLLFPPFEAKDKGMPANQGYAFILRAPRNFYGRPVGSVRVSLLGLQFVIVTTAGGILFFAFKTERKPSDDDVEADDDTT